MYASIRILKDNLKTNPDLGSKISPLCGKVREEEDACLYTPEPGLLMTFLKLLDKHKVGYEIIYDNVPRSTRAKPGEG
jgi:hypothetical protein